MAENFNRCWSCMESLNGNEICPKCQFDREKYHANPRCLRPGSLLNQRYYVGKVLGEGGFGITYVGWDSVLDLPVAIKEYFPAGIASRDTTNSLSDRIHVFEGGAAKTYQEGLNRYVTEAKSLSKFHELHGIVSIRDFFYENDTAYIIMEYIRGITLKDYIKDYGMMKPMHVFQIMKPVMRSLEKIHQSGMIHRDISPDNIMLTKEGSIKLIDFGAARIANNSDNKSLTIMLKQGFAPEEQYRTKGQQGPWTDVYAISATIYYMITGKVPPEAMERVIDDSIQDFSALGIQLPPSCEQAVMKGLAVLHQRRYQSIYEMYSDIYENSAFTSQKEVAPDTPLQASSLENILQNEMEEEREQEEIGQVIERSIRGRKEASGREVLPAPSEINETVLADDAQTIASLGMPSSQQLTPSQRPQMSQPMPPSQQPGMSQPLPPSYRPQTGQSMPSSQQPGMSQPLPPSYRPQTGQPMPPSHRPQTSQAVPPSYHPQTSQPFPSSNRPQTGQAVPPSYRPQTSQPAPSSNRPKTGQLVPSSNRPKTSQSGSSSDRELRRKKGIMVLAGMAVIMLVTGVIAAQNRGISNEPPQQSAEVAEATQEPVPSQLPSESNEPLPEFKMVNVVKKAKSEAEKLIYDMGDNQLEIKYSYAYSDSAKKGTVIRQSISKGETYIQGDKAEITLVISKGPKLVTVPRIVGKTKQQAITLLHKKKLKYEVIGYQYSSKYSAGKVMRQKLKAGKKVKKNKFVKFVVSKGAKPTQPQQAATSPRTPATPRQPSSTPKRSGTSGGSGKRPNPIGGSSKRPNPIG